MESYVPYFNVRKTSSVASINKPTSDDLKKVQGDRKKQV